MNLDKELLAEARAASGAGSDVDTVHLGLRELVRREAQKRMATFIGSEKGKAIHDAPRRREAPVKRRVRKSA